MSNEIAQIESSEASDLGLTTIQIAALSALLSGETITAAAGIAGVNRSTIHRWLREDWAFLAARNRGIKAMHTATVTGLHALAQSAMETLRGSICEGNPKTALTVLKGLGLLSGQPPRIGSEDPTVIQEENDIANCEVEAAQRLKRLYLL